MSARYPGPDGVWHKVKRQQDGISHCQTLPAEVSTCLVWLQAAEGDQLRLVLRDVHDGVGTLLARAILEQTVHTSEWRQGALT
eukprot:7099006-Prymnesium_polylepis.1